MQVIEAHLVDDIVVVDEQYELKLKVVLVVVDELDKVVKVMVFDEIDYTLRYLDHGNTMVEVVEQNLAIQMVKVQMDEKVDQQEIQVKNE